MAAPLVNSFEVLVRFGQEKWSRDVGARPRGRPKAHHKREIQDLGRGRASRPGAPQHGGVLHQRRCFLSLRCHFALLSALSRCGTSTARPSLPARFWVGRRGGREAPKALPFEWAGSDKVNIVNLRSR
eukprot:g71245.t1